MGTVANDPGATKPVQARVQQTVSGQEASPPGIGKSKLMIYSMSNLLEQTCMILSPATEKGIPDFSYERQ